MSRKTKWEKMSQESRNGDPRGYHNAIWNKELIGGSGIDFFSNSAGELCVISFKIGKKGKNTGIRPPLYSSQLTPFYRLLQ